MLTIREYVMFAIIAAWPIFVTASIVEFNNVLTAAQSQCETDLECCKAYDDCDKGLVDHE